MTAFLMGAGPLNSAVLGSLFRIPRAPSLAPTIPNSQSKAFPLFANRLDNPVQGLVSLGRGIGAALLTPGSFRAPVIGIVCDSGFASLLPIHPGHPACLSLKPSLGF